MIERLTGALAAIAGEGVVVDVGGVGFLVEVSAVTFRDLPAGRRSGDAAHAPPGARGRPAALRLLDRGGAGAVPAVPGREQDQGPSWLWRRCRRAARWI